MFRTSAELARAWSKYKSFCDGYTVTLRSVEDGRERVAVCNRPLTYTVEGFCSYNKISRQAFYKTYSDNADFEAVVECIREECEVDARRKFETGLLPSRLAGLWMARYGYSSRPTAENETDVPRFEDIV